MAIKFAVTKFCRSKIIDPEKIAPAKLFPATIVYAKLDPQLILFLSLKAISNRFNTILLACKSQLANDADGSQKFLGDMPRRNVDETKPNVLNHPKKVLFRRVGLRVTKI